MDCPECGRHNAGTQYGGKCPDCGFVMHGLTPEPLKPAAVRDGKLDFDLVQLSTDAVVDRKRYTIAEAKQLNVGLKGTGWEWRVVPEKYQTPQPAGEEAA